MALATSVANSILFKHMEIQHNPNQPRTATATEMRKFTCECWPEAAMARSPVAKQRPEAESARSPVAMYRPEAESAKNRNGHGDT